MPHQPTINVLSILGRTASLYPSASRRHNSPKQNHTSSPSKSNDYDSLSRHQRHSTLSESSPNYINQKNQSYGGSYRKSRSSTSRSRSRSPTNMQGSPGIQGSPGLDLLGKIQTECQNQQGLDLNLPETYHIDC